MSKLAIVTNPCLNILEQNATLHLVDFECIIKTDLPGFNGPVRCTCQIDSSDNANKIRDAYVDGAVAAAAAIGITLQRSDIIVPTVYRAP